VRLRQERARGSVYGAGGAVRLNLRSVPEEYGAHHGTLQPIRRAGLLPGASTSAAKWPYPVLRLAHHPECGLSA